VIEKLTNCCIFAVPLPHTDPEVRNVFKDALGQDMVMEVRIKETFNENENPKNWSLAADTSMIVEWIRCELRKKIFLNY